jgi:hypothetical protein
VEGARKGFMVLALGEYLNAIRRRLCIFDGICRGPGRAITLALVLARSRGADPKRPGTVRSIIDLGMARSRQREFTEAVLLDVGGGILDLGLGDLEGLIVELDLELAFAAHPQKWST